MVGVWGCIPLAMSHFQIGNEAHLKNWTTDHKVWHLLLVKSDAMSWTLMVSFVIIWKLCRLLLHRISTALEELLHLGDAEVIWLILSFHHCCTSNIICIWLFSWPKLLAELDSNSVHLFGEHKSSGLNNACLRAQIV